MTSGLNIGICGCGPAGLAAAVLLQRAGHRVRLFERFSMPQPVGSGLLLQPTGLAVLREMGLLGAIVGLGARIDRLFGKVVPLNRVVLDVRYGALGPGWHALAVHRAALFKVLHDAMLAAGVEVEHLTTIAEVDRAADQVALVATDGRRFPGFDLVVDALGANSPLAAGVVRRTVLPYGALWTNVPWPQRGTWNDAALEQRYRRASQMVGILPIGRSEANGPALAAFFWSLKRDRVGQWRADGIARWKSEVARLWPAAEAVVESVVDCDQLTFAQYDHFTIKTPYSKQLVHIGDSGRSTSPQLGQGANMALLDALALARALESDDSLPVALETYARLRRWHVRLFQWASATFTPFYQSDSRILPVIRDWFAAPLSRLPIGNVVLARLVSGMTTAALSKTDFKPLRLGLTENRL